ncbi:interactor of HORMAD1 protein 1-like isoform X2 [Anguilla anguilla]|nr:interactor of HORMAD1 protein 1-like isoform X2 [Anguilla anguilla]
MYPNVWNIKEILSISNGGSKSSGRSSATSDYSSLTDSQFLFGSQFWSDQMGLSQEMSLQSKNSQQNSQEVNEPKVSTNYHTKPYLFGGDSKDKSKMPNFTCSKTKGILGQFEEEKKKAKEKTESEMLMSELSQLKECMENMKNSLSSMDGNTGSTKRVVVEALNGFTITFQGAVGSMQEGFAVQLGAVLDKLNCQSEALRDMENRESKVVSEVATLATCMHSLQQELKSLRTEQARKQCMMGEMLSWLQALTSTQPPSAPVADSGVQTSPCPWERLCLVSEKTQYIQSLQLSTGPAPQPPGVTGYFGPLRPIDQEPCRTSEPNLRVAAHTEPERAEALADRTCEMHEQKPYRTHPATAHMPGIQKGAADTGPQETAAACSQPGATQENLGPLSRDDGGIHRTGGVPKLAGRQKRTAQRGQRTWMPKRRKKVQPLRGGQGSGNRGRAIMPAPTSCQSPAYHTYENAGACFNPCAGWSQDSNSIQFVSGCEATTASWVIPLPAAKTEITQKGFWQLFDFCDDSD